MPDARPAAQPTRTTSQLLRTTAQPLPTTDRPLTVGYVLKMFPRFSETFILNEILELERRGIRVVVFSMKAPDEILCQPRVKELAATRFVIPPFAGPQRWRHLGWHAKLCMRHPLRYLSTYRFARARGTRAAWEKFLVAPFIVAHAKRMRVEHFHAHFASGPARQAKLASMLSRIPFSFTAHAKDLYWKGHNHGDNNKLKKRVRLAAFVVTISEYNRRFIESLNFTVPRRRIVTIYNALDPRHWPFLRSDGRSVEARGSNGSTPSGGDAATTPLLLAVGRLVPKKGFDVLIESCARLRTQGVRFRCVIAGEGPERSRLERLIAERGLETTVSLPGSIPQDQLVGRYYREATVLVQPSVVDADGDQDGIPTVILEALAVGLPVVATDVSGIREAVLPERTGLLVTAGDAEALTNATRRILTEDDLAARLARRGRQLFEHRFNLQNNAKVLIHLMRVSARGEPRWSLMKLGERAGVIPLPDTAGGAPDQGAHDQDPPGGEPEPNTSGSTQEQDAPDRASEPAGTSTAAFPASVAALPASTAALPASAAALPASAAATQEVPHDAGARV